jgi:glycosidase
MLVLIGAAASPALAAEAPPAPAGFPHVDWSRDASIYEVNVRQFSPEGTLLAVEQQLPRLSRMGVDIVWLMPVQPIGVKNRKGTLGSYYSVRDYKAVNPEFGTLADLKHLVDEAHKLGLHVILDWVANHTAWDHAWVQAHPDWYKKNEKGEIVSFVYDNGKELEPWTDVVGLDDRQRELWPAMIDAMAFWVRETGIDGFRCDVASLVPIPFWEQAREELTRIKPLFFLAESDDPELQRKAFDMTYDWALFDTLRAVAKGTTDAAAIRTWLEKPKKQYPEDAYRMLFTGNHDTNAWTGSDAELYGPAFRAAAVLAATLPGMPLVYGGQEAYYEKRLAFFEKDPIDWKRLSQAGFYRALLRLKKRNPALRNGAQGGPVEWLETGEPSVLAYRRERDGESVTVAVNLSGQQRQFMVGEQRRSLEPWTWWVSER